MIRFPSIYMASFKPLYPMSKLGFTEKICFSSGEYASSMVWQTLMFFLPIFYTDTFGLPAAALATMFLVVRFFDAFTDPVVGMLADRTRTRWGRFRPYLLWMAVPFGLGLVLMFSTPDLSMTGKIIYAYVTYSIMMLIYTVISIPYNSMIGVVTPDHQERASLSSYKFIFAYLAGITVQSMIIPMVKSLGEENAARGYQISMMIFGSIAVVLFLITFWFSKERVQPATDQKTCIRQDLIDLMNNQPWLILFFVSLTSLIYIAIRNASIAYFFKYNLGQETAAGLFMALGSACTLLGVLPTKWLSGKIGKVRLYRICFVCVSLGSASFFFLDADQLVLIYVLQVLFSFAGGPLFPLLWSMIADTADYSEWKTGRRATGLAFSALTFSQKMGFSLGGGAVMALFGGFGFVANVEQSESSLLGIRLCLSLIPAVISMIGFIFLLFYRLDEAQLEQISCDLESRRAKISSA